MESDETLVHYPDQTNKPMPRLSDLKKKEQHATSQIFKEMKGQRRHHKTQIRSSHSEF